MEVQEINNHALPLILLGSGGALLLSSSVVFFFMRFQQRTQQQKEQRLRTELQHKEQLLHANIQAQEEERLRISKDLHDHVGSTLATLRFLVIRFEKMAPPSPEVKALSTEYKGMIDDVITDVRNISHSLAPAGLNIWGLQDTLAGLCEKTSRSAGVAMTVTTTENGLLKPLSFDHSLALYRVMQELIANTLKYAAADAVTINIAKAAEGVSVVYRDNGRGTDKNFNFTEGNGMRNIASRLRMIGASYTIDTAPGKGFACDILLPAQG